MIPKKEISLLPEGENPDSLSYRAIHWLTTVGRVVIVLTEFIVIVAFLSRFYLDRKNSDLSEVARQQKAILESTKDFEKEFMFTQNKLNTIQKFYSQTPNYSQYIKSLVESTPLDVVYDSISLQRDETTSEITSNASLFAYSEESIVGFMTNLTLNPTIKTVDIKTIEKKAKENKYLITIFISFKPAQKT
ncbi:MAG: hypothetical protein Q8P53_04320 [Candidatus Shapirobacteria bacterium]|nr:hypothetical protein [Candidatus Shapirobacteria bacterium]